MAAEITLIQAVGKEALPFQPFTASRETIRIASHPNAHAVADGEVGPFEWFDFRDVPHELARLIDANEVVLEAHEANLVLSYPLNVAAVCGLCTTNLAGFSRRDLVTLIAEAYRRIYEMEEISQTVQTPPADERVHMYNRPRSDGSFGVWGHDYNDLGVSMVSVHRTDGEIWLDPSIES